MNRCPLKFPFCVGVMTLASVIPWSGRVVGQDTTTPVPSTPPNESRPAIPATPGTSGIPVVPATPTVPVTPGVPLAPPHPGVPVQAAVPVQFGLARGTALPPVWLGIGCVPVDGALKAQLKLDHGVVVTLVAEGSPAEASELKVNDIVLSLNDQPVHDLGDFLKPLADGNHDVVMLEILRAGDKQTVQVTPGPRPKTALTPEPPKSAVDQHHVRIWNLDPSHTPRFTVVSPGIVFGSASQTIPGDVTININKQGDQPAQIEVKRGEQSWNVDAEHLGELPEEIRSWVKPMLRPSDVLHFMPANPQETVPQHEPHTSRAQVQQQRIVIQRAPDQSAAVVAQIQAEPQAPSVEERLKAIAEQLESLTKAVEQLQNDRP